MSRYKPILIALTLTLAASAAQAQQPGVQPGAPYITPPVLSPYLNMLRSGNPAVNYYGLVRPQIQQGQQLQALQYGLARSAEEAAAAEGPTTGTGVAANTGHTVGFMTYARYFNTTAPPRGR
jgi:hypothetical protein